MISLLAGLSHPAAPCLSFIHVQHTLTEPDWLWPLRIVALPYNHEKDGI